MALYEHYNDSEEDMGFIDEIVNIARSQEDDVRSFTSLEEVTLARYKNNWDDLDELCTELSARSAQDRTHEPGVEHGDGREQDFPTDTENDICGHDCESLEYEPVNVSLASNSNNNNNNSCATERLTIVAPPRRKKLAKLMATEIKENITENSNYSPTVKEVCSAHVDTVKNTTADQTIDGRENVYVTDLIARDSGSSSDHARESPETRSRSSESFVSEHEYEDLSDDRDKTSSEKALRMKAGAKRKSVRTDELRSGFIHVDCGYTLNDVRREVKNDRGGEKGTCYTGLSVERERLEIEAVRDDVVDSVSVGRGRHRHRHEGLNGGSSATSESEYTPPDGSDSRRQYTRPSNTPDINSQEDSGLLRSGTVLTSSLNEGKFKGDSGLHKEVSEGEQFDTDEDANINKTYSGGVKYCEVAKTHSIYIDSEDLQNVDETLLVRPAVRRLSEGFDPPSDTEAGDSLRDSKRLRRHSAAAFTVITKEEPFFPQRKPKNRDRSKSVADLSTGSESSQRNKSIPNRVFSAVGKFTWRVRHALKPKPVDFYVDSSSETAPSSATFENTPVDISKGDKLHPSQLYIEIGEDYSTMSRPVHSAQPSDVKTVHSYPDMANTSKPKGRLSNLFGLKGKRWNTIAALPKLLKRKPKGDKGSSVSASEDMSVASAPVPHGKTKIITTNGRYGASAKNRIAKDRTKRYDADSEIDLPTFISLDEYRRRMEEAEVLRKLELAEMGKRKQNGMGKRSRSMPYLDTSEEEEQELYNTMKSDYGRPERRRRPESHEETRYRNETDRRRTSEPIDNAERRRRYKRREKHDRPLTEQPNFDRIDKSAMKVDYGCDIYHFKGHPKLRRPQSTSDLTYDSMAETQRYSNQPRSRHSLAEAEMRVRRRPLQPRDRNSIAVASGNSNNKLKKERLPRPKSMSALPQGESLSSDDEESETMRRRKGNGQKQKVPNRRGDSSPEEIDELEDAIQKHLKHERGPLARRKIERKRTQETGSMRRLKESFMAKKIWESVYDQLLKDLSPRRSGSTLPPETAVKT